MRYPIPKGLARAEFVMSNSRFIATLDYAETVEAARAFIKSMREEMPDASHHVYAYKIGYGNNLTEGMSDDGEPSGTAGPPTRAVLHGEDLGDAVLVITRYFGGTKLGTGGLVYAYTNAAKAVLQILEREEKVSRCLIGVTLPYSFYERLKILAAQHEAVIEEEVFEGEITAYIRLPQENLGAFSLMLRELSSGQIQVVTLE